MAAPFPPCALRASDALALRGVMRGEGPLMPKPPLLALLQPNRFSFLAFQVHCHAICLDETLENHVGTWIIMGFFTMNELTCNTTV